ncbi:unnamed protein product [Closterium sp. Naga37s-1]|nr:unnamed protein product [Closterium sp. Naga37s-1]
MFDSEAIIVDPSRTQPEEQGKDYVDISFASREVELLLSADDPDSWEITPSISALYELAEDHRWKAAVGASARDSSHDMDGNAVRSGDGFKAFDVGDEPVGGVGGGFPFGDDNDDGSVVDFGGGDDGWNDDGCGFAGPPFAGGGAPGMIPAGDSDGENGYSDVDDGMDAADWLAAGMGMTRLKGSNAWAGPKHWHFVKSKEEVPAAAPEAKGRKKRAAKSELIDFSDPQIDESLFQAPKALKEIQLTKAGRKVVNTLLPKDYHYDGRKLATVFISSDWSFLARKAGGRGGAKHGFADGGGRDGFAAVDGGEDGFENDWGGDECADPFDYGDDFDGQGDSAEVKPADDFMEDLVPMPKKVRLPSALSCSFLLPMVAFLAPHPLLFSTHGSFLPSLHLSPRVFSPSASPLPTDPPSQSFFLLFFCHSFKTNRLTFLLRPPSPPPLLPCPSSPLPPLPPFPPPFLSFSATAAARAPPDLPARSSPWGIFSLFSSPASPPTPLSGQGPRSAGAPPGSAAGGAPRPPLLYRMRGAFSFLLALNLGHLVCLLALNLVLGGTFWAFLSPSFPVPFPPSVPPCCTAMRGAFGFLLALNLVLGVSFSPSTSCWEVEGASPQCRMQGGGTSLSLLPFLSLPPFPSSCPFPKPCWKMQDSFPLYLPSFSPTIPALPHYLPTRLHAVLRKGPAAKFSFLPSHPLSLAPPSLPFPHQATCCLEEKLF